jgi:hypothetical protein
LWSPALFASVTFWDKVLICAWGSMERSSYLCFPISWDGVWSWTMILLISASWVARITDLIHHTQLGEGASFEGYILSSIPFSLVMVSLLPGDMRWAAFLCHTLLPWCLCLGIDLKAMEPVDCGLTSLKTWAKMSPFSWFSQIFYHCSRYWLPQEELLGLVSKKALVLKWKERLPWWDFCIAEKKDSSGVSTFHFL